MPRQADSCRLYGVLGMTSSRVLGARPVRPIQELSRSNCSTFCRMCSAIHCAAAGSSSAIYARSDLRSSIDWRSIPSTWLGPAADRPLLPDLRWRRLAGGTRRFRKMTLWLVCPPVPVTQTKSVHRATSDRTNPILLRIGSIRPAFSPSVFD